MKITQNQMKVAQRQMKVAQNQTKDHQLKPVFKKKFQDV